MSSGAPWVWLNAGAVSISLVMVVGLLLLISVRGLSHFWPADLMSISYNEPGKESVTLVGELIDSEIISARQLNRVGVELPAGQASGERHLIKVGNRDYFGLDFSWINGPWMGEVTYPQDLMAIERREWGHFYGYLTAVKQQGEVVADGESTYAELQLRLKRSNQLISDIKNELPEAGFSQNDLLVKSLAKSLAVKTGTALTLEEQEHLIHQLFACKEPTISPTNKPVLMTLDVSDLDKKFK